MQYSSILFPTLLALLATRVRAQSPQPDGRLVPYTTGLPVCASLCGPLFDVEGGCQDRACFCAATRLSPFNNQGTTGVSSVCGPASCSTETDLQAIKTWYSGYCSGSGGGSGGSPTTTANGGSTARPTSSTSGSPTSNDNAVSNGGGGGSWVDTHKKWLIMAIVLVVGIILLWVGAWFFRRRYLRKKEREIEMNPPASWGPHQVHGGNGLSDTQGGVLGASASGGHHKEMARDSTISGKRLTKGKMGWFRANK